MGLKAAMLAGAMLAGILAVPYVEAASGDRPSRATREEVRESCRAAGGLEWGGNSPEVAEPSDERYGCISSRGWIACDHHGNCTGGEGGAQRSGDRRARPAAGSRNGG